MRKLSILIALIGSILAIVKASAQQTRILTADKHNEYGLVYCLPQTALEIEVTATRTVSLAGPYYQYAKKYIGTDKVIKQDSEKWAISDVKVSRYGVADDSARYLMQLKPGAVTFICVDEDGMLRAINKDVTASGNKEDRVRFSGNKKNEGASEKSPGDIKAYLEFVNEDFIASQSSAKQAQMLAENLMEVRESKVSLTRGTADTMPTDGRQLELMLNSLAYQEAAMMAAFCGTTYTETLTRKYTFVPEDNGRTVLFRMSDFSGFVASDDYSGDPVYLNVEITREGELPVDVKGEEKKLPKDAVMYNLPGAARVSLSFLGEMLYNKELDFAQFGVRFGLNPGLFSAKKDRSYAIFDPVTGALQTIGDDAGE